MAIYQVPVTYTSSITVTSLVFVEADSVQGARDKVYADNWNTEVYLDRTRSRASDIAITGDVKETGL